MVPASREIFLRLQEILQPYAKEFSESKQDDEYSLCGKPGPAAIKIWGGKMKYPVMPVASVKIGKSYVSYHLMPLYSNPSLNSLLSPELKKRMQGKSCLNFKTMDEKLFAELEEITTKGIASFKKLGYVE